jgi:hypothetical protein
VLWDRCWMVMRVRRGRFLRLIIGAFPGFGDCEGTEADGCNRGVLAVIRAFTPIVIKEKGVVVNIGSSAGTLNVPWNGTFVPSFPLFPAGSWFPTNTTFIQQSTTPQRQPQTYSPKPCASNSNPSTSASSRLSLGS